MIFFSDVFMRSMMVVVGIKFSERLQTPTDPNPQSRETRPTRGVDCNHGMLASAHFAQQGSDPLIGRCLIHRLAPAIPVGCPRAASTSSLIMPACCSRACGEPLPPRPVVWTARCSGVDPALFDRLGSAPPSTSARTAANDRVRTALCSGDTPERSNALGSAPTEMRYTMVSACAIGSHRFASAA
jgi:hypothetical protein